MIYGIQLVRCDMPAAIYEVPLEIDFKAVAGCCKDNEQQVVSTTHC
jgi:hypothetical protein